MASVNCKKKKGCELVWACIGNDGTPRPIGRVNAATMNSTEDTENSAYFGGTCTDNQSPLELNADGTRADTEKRFFVEEGGVAGGDKTFFLACDNSSGCTHEINLTADYCFYPGGTDPGGTGAACDPVTEQLACQGSCNIALFQINPNGSMTKLMQADNAAISSKNRTFATGNDDAHTYSVTLTSTDVEFFDCMH